MRAINLAKWFLFNNPSLRNGYIDGNTKLNKLLYFSNLMYYSLMDENLIEENFERWDNGPVIRNIYSSYRYGGLCNAGSFDIEIEDDVAKKILYIINFVYGDMSAAKIAYESHKSSIWSNANKNENLNFENITPSEKEMMKHLYNIYQYFDFQNCGIEKINGNKYIYDKSNVEMTDELIDELANIEYSQEPIYIEMIDGELVFS